MDQDLGVGTVLQRDIAEIEEGEKRLQVIKGIVDILDTVLFF